MSYLLKFQTVQSGAFKSLIEALKELLTETNIEFSSEGMKIMSMDESHTVLVRLKLLKDNFNEYICPDRIIIGVSIPNLHKLLKSITQYDILTWYIMSNDPNRLGIQIDNSEKHQKTDYRLNLLEINEEDMDIPDHQYPYDISLPSSDFQKICRDMKNLNTKTIDIKQHKNELIFSTVGDFASQTTTRTPGSNNGNLVIHTTDNEIYQGAFNLEKLIDFTKCTNLGGSATNVKMLMKKEYPLMFIYQVADLGEITLCLAPMLQQGDE